MKHIHFAFGVLFAGIFLFLTGMGNKILAQSTATIGTGTGFNTSYTYPAPYGNYYYGSKHQILIRASEMTAAGMTAGNITKLAFDVNTPTGTSLPGFTIAMKTTTVTATSTNFDNSGFVTVYGPQSYTDASGWNTHTFSTPFAWNGTSNIIIQNCFYNNNGWTQNAQMYYTTTAYNSVIYYYEDMNPSICSQSTGTASNNRPNIKFTYIPNGPPTAQFTANPTVSCSGAVTFTDQSFYNITSWLWNFGDGNTSTIQNPTHTYTASGTYSVSLKATNANGNNTLTKPGYIHVSIGSGPIAPSCTPQTTAYCCGFGITNFTFHNINNTSADASEGYADYSCGVDTVTTGQSYNISVSDLGAPSGQNFRVWIDFNNDGIFNPTGELVLSADDVMSASGTVFIPGTITLNTPLRIRVSADQSLNPVPTPCSNLQYGQAEDYSIYVKPNTNPPVSNFVADDTLSCSGTINFTDQSLNVPASWQWDFGDGNTSNLQNPTNTYTADGTYSVSLTTSNGNGNNTLVKTNYIRITLGNVPIAPSCMPSTFSYCCGYGIYKVQFNAINKSSQDASEGYKDFSCTDQTTVTEGQTYNINIQTSPSLQQDTKVWIDFNNDGTFNQANELLLSQLNTINPSGTITIPTGVTVTNTLLRMRVASDGAGSNPGPCSPMTQGQVEDYGVKIQAFVATQNINSEKTNVIVFPNPFSTSATLEVNGYKGIGEIRFELYDIYGNVVKNFIIPSSNFTLDRGNLPSGIYFYKIIGENIQDITGKISIE